MKNRSHIIIFFVLISFANSLFSQTKSAKQILNAVYSKMMVAKDYSVQANIKVDLPFVKMLPIDAKIYFKQKDKFKVESKSIAIVPRQGFDQITKMLNDTSGFDALISGEELIAGSQAIIINVIPQSDTSDLILGKLWIDVKKNVVLKSQLTTKSNGTILTEYTYGSQLSYGLPDLMTFTVDVKKFKIPKGVTADINNTKTSVDDKKKDNKKGKIFIKLTNYQINKGIPDTVFKK
jgi:hypothetical protein